MKIKLDENLPLRLATLLNDLGHDVRTFHDELLIGHPDKDIWKAAQRESRFLITQDLDFFRGEAIRSRLTPWHLARAPSFSRPGEPDSACWGIISDRERNGVGRLLCCCHRAQNSSAEDRQKTGILEILSFLKSS
jgi:Domain of unknown function (DUF5615)